MEMNRLGLFHFWIGVGGMCVFALTGQYMDRVLDHLVGMSDGPRMLYRSAHIYILLASMMNLIYGINFRPLRPDWLQGICSFIIALSPALMLLEFYCGAVSVDQPRWYLMLGLYPLIGVAILKVLNRFWDLADVGGTTLTR
jgi:hypothetical protein